MNAKYLIAALAALAALLGPAAAFAQPTPPAAEVTRAQVIAEIVQARADGTLPLSEASFLPNQFPVAKPAPAGATRAQVLAELYRARANGDICGNEDECDKAPRRAVATR